MFNENVNKLYFSAYLLSLPDGSGTHNTQIQSCCP